MIKNITSESLSNEQVVSLFGHLIKSNKQVHDFQYTIIGEFLKMKNIYNGMRIIRNVIFEQEEAVSLEEAIKLFPLESITIRNELYFILVVVSRVDGYFDKEEDSFLKQLSYLCVDRDKIESKAIKQAYRLRKLLKSENSKHRSGRRSNSNDNLFRISQKEYLATIKECRKIAYEDFEMIKPICESTIASTKTLVNKIKRMLDSWDNSSTEQELSLTLKTFAKSISDLILPAAKSYKIKLNQKESAIEDFTIVLVGRTKAGKSTLKTVLTGSGKDEIGKGKQRTTLVNYIYEWNNLRIIDTPGIDAGDDAGQVDKEIAEKALAEADVVCYLTPCDGVPKKTIDFIGEIVKENKPVLVLLNYKFNIRDEDNLEDFLDNPNDWCSDKGKNSILGYYEPIRNSAIKNGYEKMVSCYPVFLLAALMADESKYSDSATVLRKASGVDEFLASLKIIVAERGTFLRSKTIIDDCIGHCSAWLSDFKISQKNIIDQLEILKNTRISTFAKIDSVQNRFIDNSKKSIQQEFKILSTHHAKKFAESHYTQKKGIDKAWKDYCLQIGFEDNIKNNIEIELSEFSKIISDIFEDLAIDISEATKNRKTKIDSSLKLNLFPAREVTRFVGSALGIAGTIALIVANTNPIGWVLTGASVVVGVISGFFKKKADREKTAQDKLYNKLKEEIDKQCTKTIVEFEKISKKETDKIVDKTKRLYNNLQDCLASIIKESNVMCEQWEDQIAEMNKRFAERVLQYLETTEPPKVLKVERKFGNTLSIYTDCKPLCDTTKLEGLIKDEVIFIYPEYESNI